MNNILDNQRKSQIFDSFKIKEVKKAYTEGIYADTPANRKLGRVGMTYAAYAEKVKKEEGKITWDKQEDFYKSGSDENKLWQSWYRLQQTGDHSWMGVFREILAKKFPNVKSWTQTAPNTGKKVITARDKGDNIIASIDLSGDKIDLPRLQTFMDKCHAGKNEIEVLVDKTKTLKNAEGKRLDAIIEYSNSDGIKGIEISNDATNEEKRIAIAKFYNEAAEGDSNNLDEIIEDALADYIPKENNELKNTENIFVSDKSDLYDKGDGKIGNYSKPTHSKGLVAKNLYSRLKNNRHFKFKYGLDSEKIMSKLKDYNGTVNISYHDNAGTLEIYRIEFNSQKESKKEIPLSSINVRGEDEYRYVVGKSPRGNGNWAFKIGNDDIDKDPSKIHFIKGTYEAAKKAAKKEAQRRGENNVTLLP